jgi:hypothetical protein
MNIHTQPQEPQQWYLDGESLSGDALDLYAETQRLSRINHPGFAALPDADEMVEIAQELNDDQLLSIAAGGDPLEALLAVEEIKSLIH